MKRLLIVLGVVSVAAFAWTSRAPSADDVPVDFTREIQPILSNNCFKCHGPAKTSKGLRLDLAESAVRKNIIVPGKPDESEVIKRVTATDDDEHRMPPLDANGRTLERLKPAQVELLRKWIAQGAEYKPHWSFVKPKQVALPAVKNEKWARNPIDSFILARLEKEGLPVSSEADKRTLIRRVWLDLVGLLPSPKDVDDFLNDARPDAYERVVDDLLASPHYGERQARFWLDVARYADSDGFTFDSKRTMWPWRDWVIDAFNRDMPFDQFTIEQLAGDLLPNATVSQKVATGFHRNTQYNEEGGADPEQFRIERIVDRTNTTGLVWLGLTVGCAQCHNHKYDPTSQKEYYQLFSFFNSADETNQQIRTDEQERKHKELSSELNPILAKIARESNGGWQILEPKSATSNPDARLYTLEDQSILAKALNEGADSYQISVVSPAEGVVTAVRLETIVDVRLPKKGPGRGEEGDFLLKGIEVKYAGAPLAFRSARADYSQVGFDVVDIVKGGKGWAVGADDPNESNVNREAFFILEKPFAVKAGQELEFNLQFGEKKTLGRFRLSLTFGANRFLDASFLAQKLAFVAPDQRDVKDLLELRSVLALSAPPPPAPASATGKGKGLGKGGMAGTVNTLALKENLKGRQSYVLKRGDFLAKEEPVNSNTFAFLPALNVTDHKPSRLDLAKWLVSTGNPLTARVTINRIWQQYFGLGLVDTENDFGMQGSLPTHPELLDWLAVEFMNKGWSEKAMHKLIVTSATYRQASVMPTGAKVKEDIALKDPQNKLLGRQHRLRLDAEIIRDAGLSASGLLIRTIGGPGVYPPLPVDSKDFFKTTTQKPHEWPESKGPDRYRRGMYTFIWRQSQHPLLATFDCTEAQVSVTRRNRSNTPLQALHLANDKVFMEFADGLAKRLEKEAPADDASRIDYAYQLCFSRSPSSRERTIMLQYIAQERAENPDRPWAMLARVLMNLDEFIVRE